MILHPDGTIHGQSIGSADACVANYRDKKIYMAKKCDSSDQAYQWSSNVLTNGALQVKTANKNLCWNVDKVDKSGVRLDLQACDDANEQQQFSFENGLIYHFSGSKKFCITLKHGFKLKMKKCVVNRFGLLDAICQ